MEECFNLTEITSNPYKLLFNAASLIPILHYAFGFFLVAFVVVYNFFEIHFFQDLFSGFRGQPVSLTFDSSSSELYDFVVSKCRILHGRYFATPWLSSPHVQTAFLNFFGRPPLFNYRRQLFHATDGGTLALDWLLSSDEHTDGISALAYAIHRAMLFGRAEIVDGQHEIPALFTFKNTGDALMACLSGGFFHKNNDMSKDDKTPLMVVIPGLMSDSTSAYIKHLVFTTVKQGWNVVVSNHRGLGGISITSDCFYNAGWTEDVREVIDYLHREYPKAPLFVVGTSIGANILVKYLGEDGENVPIAGAAAICSPWDLLVGDRFISRKLQQKFYDRALAIGLKEYAELHQPFYSRLADWEGIKKSRSIRDFDNFATCPVGKYETVDTYYRRCSSASFVQTVSVPLLCISAMDDPVCTKEAIPWDECRANRNIVLATTQHGGHLAFFEGITAAELWWVRAVNEFFGLLCSSPLMHRQKKNLSQHSSLESSIDQGPFVNVGKGGLVAAVGNESINHVVEDASVQNGTNESVQDTEQDGHMMEVKLAPRSDIGETSEQAANMQDSRPLGVTSLIRGSLNQLSRQNRKSMWLLAYIAIITSWPLLGSALHFVSKMRRKGLLSATSVRR